MLASKTNGTLYVGVTSNLIKRVFEHKNNLVKGFTQRYNVHTLVYYEQLNDAYEAITREKRMKKWKRRWKIELIEKSNPAWKDLYGFLVEFIPVKTGAGMTRRGAEVTYPLSFPNAVIGNP
jgi:putative endonuclease